MDPNSIPRPVKWLVILVLSAVYFFGTPMLISDLGIGIISWSVILVTIASWMFGLWGAVISFLLTSFAAIGFVTLYTGYPWQHSDITGFAAGMLALIAVSIVTVRLRFHLDARRHTESQLRLRERYLTLLTQITQDVSASQDFDELLGKLVTDMAMVLEADACYITRWDEKTKRTIPLKGGLVAGMPFEKLELPENEQTLTMSVIETGQVLALEDVHHSTYISPVVAARFPAESMLGIPLFFQEHKLGALIADYNKPHRFNTEEIVRAEQAGRQISILLWNAQQDRELNYRLRESTAMAEIAQALGETERVGLGTVLQLIIDSARELIPEAERAVIHLLDDENERLLPKAVSGYEESVGARFKFRPKVGVAGRVIVSGKAINIADVLTDPRFLQDTTPSAFRSLLVAPVQSGLKTLGTISVQSSQVKAFTEDDSRLLSSLGIQAAIAIENVHLLESTQQSLKETNALYRINQELIATLDPQELMQDVVELLQENFGYSYVQIYVVDPQNGDFAMQAGSGQLGRQLKAQQHRLHPGEGIVGYTAETGASFFTNDVDEVVSFVRNPLLPEVKSQLAVPVKIDGHILGLLDIQQLPPIQLTQRDLNLVSAVADQLALALQKANLYADLQTSLQTEKAMRNQLLLNDRLAAMGRLLASVSHELNNPLQAIQNALFLLREEQGLSTQGRQDLDIVLSESERMAALIARLRATYRPARLEDFQPVQINDVIEDVYALIATHLRHNEITFEFHPDPEVPVIPALSDQLRQVVLNLLMNAVEAMPEGGRLTVTTLYLAEDDEVLLQVSDIGMGIDPGILSNIFDAFVTNKDHGTGLGLTITYDIINKHHGRIQADNNSDCGATFSVWLPAREIRTA